MSYRDRIVTASDRIMARDDWDKKIALAHLLGELQGLAWWCDNQHVGSVDKFAADLASAVERTAAMLDLGKPMVDLGRGQLVEADE